MLRFWFILVWLLSQIAVSQAADRAPRFFVSIDNSLRFFDDTKSQRTHLRDYCLYMRCAGPTDGRTGLEPEGLCAGVIEAEKRNNGGTACAAARFKKADRASYWKPARI